MRHCLALLIPLAAGGCAWGPAEPTTGPTSALIGATGAPLGTVQMWQTPGGVTFRIDASALPPGIHGVHVHAAGRCDAPSFETAGSHWNPAGRRHGFNNPAGPHAGDLPNVTVAGNGVLQETITLAGASFAALSDADGAALVIHAAADDYQTDPSGNSGARIACSVLGAVQ